MNRPALDVFEKEALAELARVESGESALTVYGEPWGNPSVSQFESAAGWRFAVFNDVQEWDYLEWVEAPDGRLWRFGDGWDIENEDESEPLMNWSPKVVSRWEDAPVGGFELPARPKVSG